MARCTIQAKDYREIPSSAQTLAYLLCLRFTNKCSYSFSYLKSLQGEVTTAPEFPCESTFRDKREAFLNINICFHVSLQTT